MKRILFISHDAGLTGAPIVLLNLLKCLRNAGYICDRILVNKKSGTLIEEFKNTADVIFFANDSNNYNGFFRRINKRMRRLQEKKKHDIIQDWIDESDIIFSNTITNGNILNKFRFTNKQSVISYIHELQMSTNTYTDKMDCAAVLKKTNVFCMQSEAVKDFLEKSLKIPSNKIKKLNYLVPLTDDSVIIHPDTDKKFTIGMMGTLNWRKGAGLIAVIIINFFGKFPKANVQFLWKGGFKETIEYSQIEYELQKAGYLDKLIIEEPSRDIDNFYRDIDVFLLCSIEDPYPLVLLHAANCRRPVICFEGSGGAPEFVQNDAGSVVPWLNINAVSESIYEYYSDKNLCNKKGNIAYQRYIDLHCNEQLVQKQFFTIAQA